MGYSVGKPLLMAGLVMSLAGCEALVSEVGGALVDRGRPSPDGEPVTAGFPGGIPGDPGFPGGGDPGFPGGGDPGAAGECQVGGCSGELCGEPGDPLISPCIFRPEFACYADATCERQADGACGFTETPELNACLGRALCGENPAGCSQTGCAEGQVCDRSILGRPSACGCDETTGTWTCTADVSGGECVDADTPVSNECAPVECGPRPLGDVRLCRDGSEGGLTGRCMRGPSGCQWEVRACPSECTTAACGVRPLGATYLCPDGSVGGVTGGCLTVGSACGWEVRDCR